MYFLGSTLYWCVWIAIFRFKCLSVVVVDVIVVLSFYVHGRFKHILLQKDKGIGHKL